MAGRLIWSHPYGEQTNVNAFRHYVNRKHSLDLQGYSQLHEWSVNNIEYFAWATWTFCGIKYSVPPTSAGTGLETMYPRPKWFPGARINYADNIISPGVVSKPDAVAITAYREGSFEVDELTFKELEREVARWANTFRKMGVVAGDRIASKYEYVLTL
jgi:acetoacetyl-CoA synthetase